MVNGLKITNYAGTILAVVGLLLAIGGLIYLGATDKIDGFFWGLSAGGLSMILIGVLIVMIGHWKVFAETINKDVVLRLSPESYDQLSKYISSSGKIVKGGRVVPAAIP